MGARVALALRPEEAADQTASRGDALDTYLGRTTDHERALRRTRPGGSGPRAAPARDLYRGRTYLLVKADSKSHSHSYQCRHDFGVRLAPHRCRRYRALR